VAAIAAFGELVASLIPAIAPVLRAAFPDAASRQPGADGNHCEYRRYR